MTQVTSYLLIRQGSASKLGPNASGLIHYAVLTSTDRTGIYIALTANENKGCFSREAVPLSCLEQCTQGLAVDTPLRYSAFKPAFKGQCVNHSGFMAAVLVGEGQLNKTRCQWLGKVKTRRTFFLCHPYKRRTLNGNRPPTQRMLNHGAPHRNPPAGHAIATRRTA